MSGNTPAELIERLWMPTERTKYSEFGPAYINPDGPEAADQLTVLTAALERIGKRKMGGPFKSGQVVGERREMIAIARAALTGEQG